MESLSQKELVLVGGGHTHIQVIRRFAMQPPPDTHLTIVLDRPLAVYSGMVPGFVAGQYSEDELEIDVVPLARRAMARVILSAAVRVDASRRLIYLKDRPPIKYDVASIDIGSTVAGLNLPGIREHAIPTRPVGQLVQRINDLVTQVASRERNTPFRVIVAGAGAGGVELAFTLRERLGVCSASEVHITLVHPFEDVLKGYPHGLRERVYRNAKDRNIEIVPNKRVQEAKQDVVVYDDGSRMPYEALLWATGAFSHSIFIDSKLPVDERGFVSTRDTLQVAGFKDLFAVGDCATMENFPETPKAGVYAVRQGPYLIANLFAALAGRPLRRYKPQGDFLTLLNLGNGTALGAKWGLSFEGKWVMGLKDWIDRRFMRKFQVLDRDGAVKKEFESLPSMSNNMNVLCGGCAAKVGQSVLTRALGRLEPPAFDDTVKLGLNVPDDASAYTTPNGDLVVSSVDAFRAFVDDPYFVGRIAAINALSDLYATGATPRYVLSLVAVPQGLSPEDSEEILFQVLSGARAVFDTEGVTLLGGHTTTAPELLVGFSVDGYVNKRILTIDRLAVGDCLLLTKSLGTGVLLHADMQGCVTGAWLQKAFDSMLESNMHVARLLPKLDVTAVTDITGFGLIGHLGELLRTSGVSAVVDVSTLPALPGSVELMAQGYRSTFHSENEKSKKGILIRDEAALHSKLELLFDPQTSGGLLFGLSEELVPRARDLLGEISVIGKVADKRDDGALIEIIAS